jgi:hypothetical protein
MAVRTKKYRYFLSILLRCSYPRNKIRVTPPVENSEADIEYIQISSNE